MNLKAYLKAFGLDVIAGTIGGLMKAIDNLTEKFKASLLDSISAGAKAFTQYNHEAMTFGRQAGMSLNEARAYSEVLISRASTLAQKYGLASEAVLALQKNISETTGRMIMLNDVQAEDMIQEDRTVGADTANQFRDTIMQNLGGQLSTASAAIAKSYATAAKSGLNAAKFSKQVASNLQLANKLTFKDGVNGIIKMTALSEKLGFNLQSIENVADKFMDFDSSIESSAQLQMLGGAAGAYGSNPLTMMYEANYDPEALTQRTTDMLKGYATFNAKTGLSEVNGLNRDMVKNIAQGLGMSMDEAMTIAKKQAEMQYKESHFSNGQIRGLVKGTEGSDARAKYDFIMNKSYIEDGQLMFNDMHGNKHNLSQNGMEGMDDVIAEMQKFDGMSDRDIMEEQASSLLSIDDKIQGIQTSFVAKIAEQINKNEPQIMSVIGQIGNFLNGDIAPMIANGVKGIFEWVKENKETIKTVASTAGSVLKWLMEQFGNHPIATLATVLGLRFAATLLPMMAGWKLLGQKVFPKLRPTVGSPAAASVPKASFGERLKSGAKSTWKAINPKTYVNNLKDARGLAKIGEGNTLKNAWKLGGKALKGTIGIGAALGVAEGAYSIYNHSNRVDEIEQAYNSGQISKQERDTQIKQADIDRNAGVGSAIGGVAGMALGTMIAGPLGGAVGGWLGGKGGEMIGEHWDNITKTASKAWDKTKEYANVAWGAIKNVGSHVWNGVAEYFKGIWKALGDVVMGFWNGFVELITAPFRALGQVIDGIKDGVQSIFNGHIIDGILAIGKGVFSGLLTIIAAPFKSQWEVIKGFGKGFIDYAHGVWNSIKATFGDALSHLPIIGKYFVEEAKPKQTDNAEKHANGGIVGGNSYSGDKILARLNSGEMVLNQGQQTKLFNIVNNLATSHNNASSVNSKNMNSSFTNSNSLSNYYDNVSNVQPTPLITKSNETIKPKPVGEKEYIYTPKGSETSNVNGNTITVKDFNINISGTIKLDGGNSSTNVDARSLLNDRAFMEQLKEMVRSSINSDMYGGRVMKDISSVRGGLPLNIYQGAR